MSFRAASLVKVFGLTQLHSSVCLCTTFLLFVPRPRSMYNPILPPLSLVSVFAVHNVLMRTKMQWKPVVNFVNSLAAGVGTFTCMSSCSVVHVGIGWRALILKMAGALFDDSWWAIYSHPSREMQENQCHEVQSRSSGVSCLYTHSDS